MSEPSINLPLSMFKDKTMKEIVDGINEHQNLSIKLGAAESKVDHLKSMLRANAEQLRQIIDYDAGPMEKAQAFRSLSLSMLEESRRI